MSDPVDWKAWLVTRCRSEAGSVRGVFPSIGDALDEAADALEAAEAWKAGATAVIEQWEACWNALAKELTPPANLGRSKADLVREWIEAAEAKLAAIDALHRYSPDSDGCFECFRLWPCPTHLVLHPEEEQ